VQPPPGWGIGSTVWLLHKGVNGQAARAWNIKLTATVEARGFHPSGSDASLFVKGAAQEATYLLCYVDDILIAGERASIAHR
jgi:hypothetical protein